MSSVLILALVLVVYLACFRGWMWTIAYKNTTGALATDNDAPLASDQTMPVDSGSHPLFPFSMRSVWFWAGGATLSRVRINAPKFRGIVRPMIRPIEQAANPSSRPIIMESWRNALQYNATEPIAMLCSNGAAETDWVVATFGDGNRNAPQGDLYTARFTSTFTATTNAWTAAPSIVFDDTLPTGQFSIIGVDQFAAGGVAMRLIFLGMVMQGVPAAVRPGIPVPTANGSQSTRYVRYGYLGEFGRFQNTALPTIEVLYTAATANPEGYLDIIKVG
jgi:hypothetical protein